MIGRRGGGQQVGEGGRQALQFGFGLAGLDAVDHQRAEAADLLQEQDAGLGELSAVQEVERQYGLPVVPIANLNDLFTLLQNNAEFGGFLEPVKAYRERYGAA